MSREFLTLDELVQRVGRDRRTIEKQVQRGVIPGRRVNGEWRFDDREITHWLEQDLRTLDDSQLEQLEISQNSPEFAAQTPLQALLKLETCEIPLDAGTKPSVLQALVEIAGRTWQVWDPSAILSAVRDRETVMSTAFANGVAIPHPRNPLPDALGESLIAFGRTSSGIPFGGPQRSLTDIFFLVLARDSRTHLQILARLGRLIQDEELLNQLRGCENSAAAWSCLIAADQQLG
jgi:PTS system nitrogen regulatory IIA component